MTGPLPISYGFVGFKKDFGDVDGAFVWPGNNLLYIFKGKYYWRVYINGPIYRVAAGYPRKISNAWGGVPNDIDGVTTWANGVTYFFKGKLANAPVLAMSALRSSLIHSYVLL